MIEAHSQQQQFNGINVVRCCLMIILSYTTMTSVALIMFSSWHHQGAAVTLGQPLFTMWAIHNSIATCTRFRTPCTQCLLVRATGRGWHSHVDWQGLTHRQEGTDRQARTDTQTHYTLVYILTHRD